MEIERATLHRGYFLSNVAIEMDGDTVEVECHGVASSTLEGETLIVFGGRYLNQFAHVNAEWQMCRSEYVLDHHFMAPMPPLGDAMGELQPGTGLDLNHRLFHSHYAQQTDLDSDAGRRHHQPAVYLRISHGDFSRLRFLDCQQKYHGNRGLIDQLQVRILATYGGKHYE